MQQTTQQSEALLGVGIYSIQEVARLTKVPAPTVRRWVKGYTFVHHGEVRSSPAVTSHQLPVFDGTFALGFRGLIEVRVVHAMRSVGIPWKTIRLAREHAAQIMKSDTPFASARLMTDGRGVFSFIGGKANDRSLIELSESQYTFRSFLAPHLVDVEFDTKAEASRWWPLGSRRSVLLDPQRSFGQPIVREGVPTSILAAAAKAGSSVESVAKWYELPVRSVRDAVEFEESLHAKTAA